MLAGVPLLRTRRHGRGTALLQPASYVAAAAHLAVAILVFTNVVQMYYLFTQTGATCTVVAPCSSSTATIRQHKEPLAGSLRQGGALQTAMPVTTLPAVPAAELPFPDRHFAIFIIFSWNYELFRTSLDTYMAAGWGKRAIILDNSMDRIILNDPEVRGMVGEVISTRVKLSFSQAQNFIADIALERNYTYYFWGHADVALLASDANSVFAEEVLECMDVVMETEPNWGVTFFAYDWFSAVRTPMMRHILYDTFIPVYMSDCDFYPRVRRNWKTLNHLALCPEAKVHVFDMRRELRLPLHNYTATKEVLEGEVVDDVNRNAWKVKEWSLGEHVGWELWEMAAREYFRFKWGLPPEGKRDCEVESTDEDGNTVWRQYPFETFADMVPQEQAIVLGASREPHRMF